MLGKSSKDRENESEGSIRSSAPTGVGGASLISRDMRILGDCRTDGRLRIDGSVTGNVSAGGLEVAKSGTVEGDVAVEEGGSGGDTIVVDGTVKGAVRGTRVEVGQEGRIDGGLVATEATVHGRVRGGILAEQRLILEETAEVEGDVRARRLALKEGGQVNGNIQMGERATEGSDLGSGGSGKKATTGTPRPKTDATAGSAGGGSGSGEKGSDDGGESSGSGDDGQEAGEEKKKQATG